MSTEPNPHQDAIDGLRAAADFLDAHPEMPGTASPWIFVYGKYGTGAAEALSRAVDVLGPDVEVKQDKFNVDLHRKFGPVDLYYRAYVRDVAVERTVTKQVTEHVVPALDALAARQVAEVSS